MKEKIKKKIESIKHNAVPLRKKEKIDILSRDWQVRAYLRDAAHSVPGHCNKVSITIKQVVIVLLVEGLAFDF